MNPLPSVRAYNATIPARSAAGACQPVRSRVEVTDGKSRTFASAEHCRDRVTERALGWAGQRECELEALRTSGVGGGSVNAGYARSGHPALRSLSLADALRHPGSGLLESPRIHAPPAHPNTR